MQLPSYYQSLFLYKLGLAQYKNCQFQNKKKSFGLSQGPYYPRQSWLTSYRSGFLCKYADRRLKSHTHYVLLYKAKRHCD